MEKIYENLMKAYYTKGKIGNVKPFDIKHAQKIAHAVALSIVNRERKCA